MLKKRRITIQTKKMNGMNANDFEVSVWFKIWKLVNYITSTYSNDRSTLYKSIRWATKTAAAATSSSATTATATTYHQYIDEQTELWNVSSSTQHSTAQHTAHEKMYKYPITNTDTDLALLWLWMLLICLCSDIQYRYCVYRHVCGMAWHGIA